MTATGHRDTLLTFQRAVVSKNDHGDAIETWGTYATEWASVRFGGAQERREAAQQSATQAATFRVLSNSLTRALTPKDRIGSYLDANWDITGIAPFRDEVEITAVRKA